MFVRVIRTKSRAPNVVFRPRKTISSLEFQRRYSRVRYEFTNLPSHPSGAHCYSPIVRHVVFSPFLPRHPSGCTEIYLITFSPVKSFLFEFLEVVVNLYIFVWAKYHWLIDSFIIFVSKITERHTIQLCMQLLPLRSQIKKNDHHIFYNYFE